MDNYIFLDVLIDYLKDIKKNNTQNLSITYLPEIMEIGRTIDGTCYGQKHLNIDIIYEELYIKKEEMLGDWKLQSKNKKNINEDG